VACFAFFAFARPGAGLRPGRDDDENDDDDKDDTRDEDDDRKADDGNGRQAFSYYYLLPTTYYLLPTTFRQKPMTSKPADNTTEATKSLAPARGLGLGELLGEHCSRLGAEGGAILTVEADGQIGIPAVWPTPGPGDEPPDWLTAALRAAASAGESAVGVTTLPLHEAGGMYGDHPSRHLVLAPLPGVGGGLAGAHSGGPGAGGEIARQTSEQDGSDGDFARKTSAQGGVESDFERQTSVQKGEKGVSDGLATGETRDFAGSTSAPGHAGAGKKAGFTGEKRGIDGPAGGLGAAGARRRAFLAMALTGEEPEKLAKKVLAMGARVPAGQLYALHLAAEKAPAAALAPAMGLLSAVNDHERFIAAGMALCNEVASGFQCERVSLGLLRGRYVQLAAMSHTEKFSRKMQMVQLIEAVMEECADQDIEVLVPAEPSAEYACRGARELSESGTPRLAVLTLPLRRDGKVIGAVCMERSGDIPFSPAEVETLRLACDLCTARLADLRRRDRWVGAKLAAGLRSGFGVVLGSKHTWAKVVVLLAIAAGAYMSVATGDYRIETPFSFQATRKQIVPSPYDGQVESVSARLGEPVKAGDVLASLKTLPLQRKLDQSRAELFEHRKHADAARSDKKWAEAQMAAARARQLQEQISLLDEQIAEATVTARIDGTVIRGDLERFVGSSVEKGQVLFEIASLDSLRAEVLVPEDQVADLLAAMRAGKVRATLAAESYPDRPIDAVIERVLPLAEKIDGEVVFRVRARLAAKPQGELDSLDWMRPGMEGTAHVSLGRRKLAWIWSRRLINRLRLWLWM